MAIKAVIFDFDGVVFDTEKKRFHDLGRALYKHGFIIEDSMFHDFLGKKSDHFVREHFPAATREQSIEIAEMRRHYQFQNLKEDVPISGIKHLLIYIRDRGWKTAVATGSKRPIVWKLLLMHGLEKYFDIVITGEEFKTTKPNPECYLLAAKRLGVKPAETIVIEDAPNGVKAGKAAGCLTFGLKTYLKGNELKEADKVFPRPTDIKKYLMTKKFT